MNTQMLMEEATRRTGLAQWGNMAFIEPLKALVDSFDTDFPGAAQSTREDFQREILALLATRLRVERDLALHPEILEVEIRRPLFIVGLPRTGSTLLHNLLAQDTSCRYLAFWEIINPSPPPEAKTRENDPRIRVAEARLARLHSRLPELEHKHRTTATAPEECKRLFNYTFMNDFWARWPVPSYHRWLRGRDRSGAYQYYRRLLQLLTWRCPGDHLVLKSPSHLTNLDALFRVFPDACVVWLHRSPLSVIPSICSLRSTFKNSAATETNGWRVLKHCSESLKQALEWRDRQSPGHFHDVKYDDLVSDPHRVVKTIYEEFGYQLPEDMNRRMSDWLREHPKDKHGVHRYSLEDYELDKNTINEQFLEYCHRFGIET